jgi:CheY-like chemotaxis protein
MARDALPEQDPVREDLDEILAAGRRAAELTRQLLAFGRRQAMSPAVVDLNAGVAGIEKMLRRLIREDIELVTTAHPRETWVQVDPGQLEQMLVNLVVNARDAMPAGGRITVATAVVTISAEEARRHPEGAPGDWVRLRVEDTGVGMDEETMRHVFEPYYTTKKAGKGTGLGLSMVYGIVRQSRGFIDVTSRPGQGATFDLHFPLAKKPVATAPLLAGEPLRTPAGRPGETVLLVEDEPRLLELMRARLTSEGRIDVLLSDVVMPRLGGPALAERFQMERPGSQVVFMSGYADAAVDPEGRIRGAAGFVQKPGELEVVPALLRRLLDGRPAREPTP